MKVLLIHALASHWDKAIPKAFEELGHKTLSINYRDLIISRKFCKYLRYAGFYLPYLSTYIQKKIVSFKPDLIYVSQGELLTPQILEKLRSYGIPMVNWVFDGMWIFSRIQKTAPYYDYFFTFDPETIRQLEKQSGYKKGHYLPLATLHTSIPKGYVPKYPKDYYQSDIAFAGTCHFNRLRLFQELKKTEKLIKIWGAKGWKKSIHSDIYAGSGIYGNELNYAYSSAKIIINIHYGFEMEEVPYYDGVNLRTFEIAVLGTPMVSNYQADLNNLFETPIITYNSYEELLERIEYFFDNYEQCKKNASLLQEEVINKHTIKHRIARLLEVIK